MSVQLRPLFVQLRALFKLHEAQLVLIEDEPTRYFLGSHELRPKDGRRTPFGGLEVRKAYVTVHLTPIALHPELKDDLSPALKKRMHGKACFNFKSLDDTLAEDLAAVIARGVVLFEADGRLSPP